MLSPAAQRTLAAEELAAARVSGDAAALARAEERWEALQESVIGFDPRLHPRNRAGQFRHSLMNLGKGGISEVDLPNGMTVKKAVGGGYRLTDRSGHKLGRHMSVDKVMRRIEKEGVNLHSDRPREVSMTERVKVFAPERVTALASSGIDVPKVQPREALIAHLGSKGVSFPDETVSRILPYDNRYLWQDFKPGPTRIKYGHVVSMRGTGTLNFPDRGRTMEVDVTYHSPIGKPGNPGKTLTTVTQKKTGTPIEDVLRSEGISPDPTPVGGSASYAEHLASLSTSSLVSNWDTNYTNMKAGVVDRDGGAQRQIDMAQIELEMRKRGISVELWRAETPQGRQDRINRYFHKEQREQGEAEGAALVMDSPVVVDGLSERRPGRVVKTNKDSVDVEVTREDGTTYVSRFRRETIRKGVFSSAVSISIPPSRRNTLRSEGVEKPAFVSDLPEGYTPRNRPKIARSTMQSSRWPIEWDRMLRDLYLGGGFGWQEWGSGHMSSGITKALHARGFIDIAENPKSGKNLLFRVTNEGHRVGREAAATLGRTPGETVPPSPPEGAPSSYSRAIRKQLSADDAHLLTVHEDELKAIESGIEQMEARIADPAESQFADLSHYEYLKRRRSQLRSMINTLAFHQ